MKLLQSLRALRDLFRVPTPAELAQRELEEAERELLKAQSGREYADAMVTYQQRRVTRLRAYVEANPVHISAVCTLAANDTAAHVLRAA